MFIFTVVWETGRLTSLLIGGTSNIYHHQAAGLTTGGEDFNGVGLEVGIKSEES